MVHKVDENFRDQLSTVSKEGKRNWIYPKKPAGKFYNARTIFSIILLAILFGTPFIKYNGRPFVLLNILERNFILFGIPFGPHDFHLFVIAMIAFIVFIFLFTAVFGRVFCGWACPQTIFLEMVFRKIEYWIEGDYRDQMRLNASPWDAKKTFKKVFKHSIFFGLSFLIANTFLAYIIGIDELIKIVTDPPADHIKGLIAITAFSGIFYWVFSYFREQACTIVCPYGRLQGVLLDQESLIIAYDYVRGEPRGKIKKNEPTPNLGDCVDCHLCVDVCPTGIDIRNGLQLECVNCTACIDACDDVMVKVNRPKGLIRYASQSNIENKTKFKLTGRVKLYSILLVSLLSILTYLLVTRTDYDINILRTPGMLFQEQPNGMYSNLYDINIINKTYNSVPIEVRLDKPNGELKLLGKDIMLSPHEKFESKFMILLPGSEIEKMNTPVKISIFSEGKKITEINSAFLAPIKKHEKEKHEEKEDHDEN